MNPIKIKRFREVEDTIYPPDQEKLRKHKQFRKGQQDRKDGKPCASTNGQYLEGWYNPDKKAYYITEDQSNVFGL